jgi:hypothetical protein
MLPNLAIHMHNAYIVSVKDTSGGDPVLECFIKRIHEKASDLCRWNSDYIRGVLNRFRSSLKICGNIRQAICSDVRPLNSWCKDTPAFIITESMGQ